MAEGDPLPDSDSFGIACSQSKINRDTGKAEPSAFVPKPNDTYVSGGWMELCGMSRPTQIKEFCRQLLSIDYGLSKNYKIAVLAVGDTVTEIQNSYRRELSFIHHPDNAYDCHSGMYGTGAQGVAVEEELAELALTFPVDLDE